ncbi:MAG: hypothetical protein A2622_03755 [Bdellovibrionales bacterium RIFCSPHIGHO2_01_FULL_40_29]|nr:MAG: hypothetical protein A2622_03755 [Bdellovibrionales bacterium RIFCSPHIGHO2_01_FULL_40_29]OFZ35368.1 MAG: hypothetical protein A3D17_08275 [Bdellovibrionales bacterium RIFCSPHIGHO2_02_FULL_40_15]
MKKLIIASIATLLSVQTFAKGGSDIGNADTNAALRVNGTKVTFENLHDIEINQEGSGADMYVFIHEDDNETCFTGDSKEVKKIISEMLYAGTGDSALTDLKIRTSKKQIKLLFSWYDEGGDHTTERIIMACE